MWFNFNLFSTYLLVCVLSQSTVEDLNLHPNHLPYYFHNYPTILENCKLEEECPYHGINKSQLKCWGYEDGCSIHSAFFTPRCPGDHKGWVKNKAEQLSVFYSQADYGYVAAHRSSLKILCEPTFLEDSALECTNHLQFCRGRNLLLNLTRLKEHGVWRYRMDILKPGDFSGWCHLHEERLFEQLDHMSPLQSWAPELRNFQKLPNKLDKEVDCDIFINRPTFIIKIDATVNMYHHFCDFLNLYASLHVNSSHPSAFSTDVNIIIWETYPYYSAFKEMWRAFTEHPIVTIDHYAGQTICFRNVVFPLLPRMIFGLYYNTPLVYGCEGSGLFKSFSQHILHRLKIPRPPRNNSNVKITLLSRETSYRNIVNEAELLEVLAKEPEVEFRRVVFNHKMPFKEQLSIIRDTDIFIGMHGAGLTHMLFLPEWAAVFELYNCGDESCYMDLAHLSGIRYATWEKRKKLKSRGGKEEKGGIIHEKFVNYSFDANEFRRIVRSLLKYVRNHSAWLAENTQVQHDEL